MKYRIFVEVEYSALSESDACAFVQETLLPLNVRSIYAEPLMDKTNQEEES